LDKNSETAPPSMACGGQPLKIVFNGAVSEGDSAPAVARGHDWKQSSRSDLIRWTLDLAG
jgi:hypothetical protein